MVLWFLFLVILLARGRESREQEESRGRERKREHKVAWVGKWGGFERNRRRLIKIYCMKSF